MKAKIAVTCLQCRHSNYYIILTLNGVMHARISIVLQDNFYDAIIFFNVENE
jgi:hypothetical protein